MASALHSRSMRMVYFRIIILDWIQFQTLMGDIRRKKNRLGTNPDWGQGNPHISNCTAQCGLQGQQHQALGKASMSDQTASEWGVMLRGVDTDDPGPKLSSRAEVRSGKIVRREWEINIKRVAVHLHAQWHPFHVHHFWARKYNAAASF